MAIDVAAVADPAMRQRGSPGGTVSARRAPAEHLLAVPGGEWTVWRAVVLRATGFPAARLAGAAGDRAPAAADAYVAARAEVIAARQAALAELGRELRVAPSAARPGLRAARRRLRQGRFTGDRCSQREQRVTSAMAARQAALVALEAAYEHDRSRAEAHVIGTLSEDRFREAIVWQNLLALQHAEHGLLTGPRGARRAACGLLARLLQRFTLKNESVGFFGPVGWASLSDEPTIVRHDPAEQLLARREVYFEGWAIQELVSCLDANPALKTWLAPRIATGVWHDGASWYAPALGEIPTTPVEQYVLALCNGNRAAREIAGLATADPASGLASPVHVYDVIQRLVARKLLVWRLEVAPQLHPERELRLRLARIEDPPLRHACLAALDRLVRARDRVARAAGCSRTLQRRFAEMNQTFTRLTGREARRRPGEMYAARGLVYEDCRRADTVTLGAGFLARVGPSLSIVLDAAHWAAGELARGFRQQLRTSYADLVVGEGGVSFDAHCFYTHVLGRPQSERLARIADVERRFRAKWQAVLDTAPEDRRVLRSVEQIASRAREAFRTAERTWSRTRYLSPDILVGASDVEAFRRGEFMCVLGEVHSGNSLLWSALVSQHSNPERLAQAVTQDAQHVTTVFTQVPSDRWLARLNLAARPSSAWRYEFHEDLPSLPGCRALPAAGLLPYEDGGTIRIRARDGAVDFDAIELFGAELGWEVDSVLKQYLPDAPHLPRVTIDDLTIGRERWYATTADMPFLAAGTPAAQFALLRRWAQERGMPRHLFYKSPQERKPCYLDLGSPVYAELFMKVTRQLTPGQRLRLEEMLPCTEQAWLTDSAGHRYTSEFRFATRIAEARP
jgi:hypothetical protein